MILNRGDHPSDAAKWKTDYKYERGGAEDIGTDEEGAIVELINLDERLIVIKERAI